ncbi:30S ribosomal protein S13 [Patescibacteria group bacterium]|nr:30S ribosomal protein S13 [Patescibacteria group bacterium]MBU1922203.1 30S ribosomal protein S13 [Patescibacteria group bacterium]
MARIANVNIPQEKRIEVALTYIFGVGISRASQILQKADVDKNKRTKDLSEDELNKIRGIIEKGAGVEGELKKDIHDNIKRLKEIGAYRGTRHIKHLPSHGQRTKTNSRTCRGNVRKTMSSGKKAGNQKT